MIESPEPRVNPPGKSRCCFFFFPGFGKRIFFFFSFFGEASPLSSFFSSQVRFCCRRSKKYDVPSPWNPTFQWGRIWLETDTCFRLAKDKPPSPDGKTPGSKEVPCGGWFTYQTHRLDHHQHGPSCLLDTCCRLDQVGVLKIPLLIEVFIHLRCYRIFSNSINETYSVVHFEFDLASAMLNHVRLPVALKT